MSDSEALKVNYCPEHGDALMRDRFGRDGRSARCSEAHSVEEIVAAVGDDAVRTVSASGWEPVAVDADPFPWRDPEGKVRAASPGWVNGRRLVLDPRPEYAAVEWRAAGDAQAVRVELAAAELDRAAEHVERMQFEEIWIRVLFGERDFKADRITIPDWLTRRAQQLRTGSGAAHE